MIKAKLLTEAGLFNLDFPEFEGREDVYNYVTNKLKEDQTVFELTDGRLIEIFPETKVLSLEIWEEVEEDPKPKKFKPPAPGLDLKREEKFFRRDGITTYLGNDIIIKFQGCVGQYKVYYLPVFIETDKNKVEVRQDLALSPDNLKTALKSWADQNLNGREEEVVTPPGELGGWEEAKEYLEDYVEAVEERMVPKDLKNAKAAFGIRSND